MFKGGRTVVGDKVPEVVLQQYALDKLSNLCTIYSPLHTICHCSWTMTKLLFHEKIKFRETWQKEVYTLFVTDPSFCKCVEKRKIGRKKFFAFVKKLPTPANAFCEKVFRKMLTNLTNHSLHTIRVSHGFCPFVLFSSWLANSV